MVGWWGADMVVVSVRGSCGGWSVNAIGNGRLGRNEEGERKWKIGENSDEPIMINLQLMLVLDEGGGIVAFFTFFHRIFRFLPFVRSGTGGGWQDKDEGGKKAWRN
jgi:hypothetical protein